MLVKSKEPVGPCEISLDIEVESSKVAEAVDKAYREFSQYIAVPGFRRGKAPMAFVRQRVPQDQLRERTVEILTGPAYEQAITESKIVPYTRPKMELVNLKTAAPDYVFEFKAIVPLPPTVTLGKYVGLSVDRERTDVSDADVESRIEMLRDRDTDYPIIDDRPAAIGDVVYCELSVTLEGVDSDGEFKPTAITLGEPGNVPGVDDELVGVVKGQEKSFAISYPANYPNAELAGTSAEAVVRVKEIHGRVAPDLDDAFAKAHGAETMDELRSNQRAELEKRRFDIADSAVGGKLVDAIVADSKIEYPPVLLDLEMEGDIKKFNEELNQREMSLQQYVERGGTTEEELLEQFRGRAELRIRRGLTLGEIARTEKIEMKDEDIEQEIEKRAEGQRTSAAAIRAYLDRTGEMDGLRDTVFTKKIIDFVRAASTINDKVLAPADAAPVTTAEAPKAKRTRKKKDAVAEPAETE